MSTPIAPDRDDVIRVALTRDAKTTIAQIAKDFGISESCLRNWLQRADVEDGHRPGVTTAESAELRELKRQLAEGTALSRRYREMMTGPAYQWNKPSPRRMR